MVSTHHISGRITIVIEGMSVKTKPDPDSDSITQLVEQRTFNPSVASSNLARVMVKRLHELIIHSSFRLNNLNKVVKSFLSNEDHLVCDSDTCVVEHSIHIGTVL